MLTAALAASSGCVERKVTVTSTPPGARVYLDDEEKGCTPVTFRFDFYGHRNFVLKKDGYRIKEEPRKLSAPFYSWPFVDIFAGLMPISIKDHKTFHFELEPVAEASTEGLVERAKEMRMKVSGPEPAEAVTPKEAPRTPPAEPPRADEKPVREPVPDRPIERLIDQPAEVVSPPEK
jgi:hypothetical protein